MSIMKVDYGDVGGDANVWRTTTTLDNNGQATITDCPISPDVVLSYYYQDNRNGCVDMGGNNFVKCSAGLSAGTNYSFTAYGVTVSGSTISIASGFNIARNQQVEVVVIQNS